ncbi:shematrin-like protein 2 [Paramacrobiotus metropolitanus]|uniref:shematrin-like protein 2 n=1 Tax=Paramacrobiotus metropolitanus TaxID=2943436 RepID=UPI002445C540|nr:shematrin-like protein 2 [Paramacrobiotus metropolitanus]
MEIVCCAFILFSILSNSVIADHSDTADDDDRPYDLPVRTPKPSSVSQRTRNMFNTLGNMLVGNKKSSSAPAPPLNFSEKLDDYPPYPGDNTDSTYSGGNGAYSNSYRQSFQKVIYIAVPLNALTALLSTGQLSSVGFGSIFPALPSFGSRGFGGSSAYGSGNSFSGSTDYGGGVGVIGTVGGSSGYNGNGAAVISVPAAVPPPPPLVAPVGGLGGGNTYAGGGGTYGGGGGYNGNGLSVGPVLTFGGNIAGPGTYGGGGDYNRVVDFDTGSYGAGAGGYIGTTGGSYGAGGNSFATGGGAGNYGGGGLAVVTSAVAPPPPTLVAPPPVIAGSLPCPRGAGYYRHPVDCNRFYRCVDVSQTLTGTAFKVYEFNCPAGTVYSIMVWVCVWPYQREAGTCYVAAPLPLPVPAVPVAIPGPVGIGHGAGYNGASYSGGAYGGGGGSYGGGGGNYGGGGGNYGGTGGGYNGGGGGSYGGSSSGYSVGAVLGSGTYASSAGSYGSSYNDDDRNKNLDIDFNGDEFTTRKPRKKVLAITGGEDTATFRPRCLGVGFFAHPFDCTQFAQCWKSTSGDITGYYFKCPPKTVFNPRVPVCDDATNMPDLTTSCLQKLLKSQ